MVIEMGALEIARLCRYVYIYIGIQWTLSHLLHFLSCCKVKNSLVSLDAESTASGSSHRRKVADAVVKVLTPYYSKKKKIASKVYHLTTRTHHVVDVQVLQPIHHSRSCSRSLQREFLSTLWLRSTWVCIWNTLLFSLKWCLLHGIIHKLMITHYSC